MATAVSTKPNRQQQQQEKSSPLLHVAAGFFSTAMWCCVSSALIVINNSLYQGGFAYPMMVTGLGQVSDVGPGGVVRTL
jgi:hypothetical protein